ncbi:DgyrCDS7419 [Dimorphilus gyrociliatus]|uniref:DgyrCDS7419 n=1 Tax=Dimorphilus gyrociliatus TaxID=2664684 RepID=A0A7I8VT79_9ANNE|nr:DgyrCDS7419 [Dimorphilus gyrociliatus]
MQEEKLFNFTTEKVAISFTTLGTGRESQLTSIQLCSNTFNFIIDFDTINSKAIKILKEFFESDSKLKIMFHSLYMADLLIYNYGIVPRNVFDLYVTFLNFMPRFEANCKNEELITPSLSKFCFHFNIINDSLLETPDMFQLENYMNPEELKRRPLIKNFSKELIFWTRCILTLHSKMISDIFAGTMMKIQRAYSIASALPSLAFIQGREKKFYSKLSKYSDKLKELNVGENFNDCSALNRKTMTIDDFQEKELLKETSIDQLKDINISRSSPSLNAFLQTQDYGLRDVSAEDVKDVAVSKKSLSELDYELDKSDSCLSGNSSHEIDESPGKVSLDQLNEKYRKEKKVATPEFEKQLKMDDERSSDNHNKEKNQDIDETFNEESDISSEEDSSDLQVPYYDRSLVPFSAAKINMKDVNFSSIFPLRPQKLINSAFIMPDRNQQNDKGVESEESISESETLSEEIKGIADLCTARKNVCDHPSLRHMTIKPAGMDVSRRP